MIIKVLYVILGLSAFALVAVAIALYFRVKKHMANPVDPHHPSPGGQAGGDVSKR